MTQRREARGIFVFSTPLSCCHKKKVTVQHSNGIRGYEDADNKLVISTKLPLKVMLYQ